MFIIRDLDYTSPPRRQGAYGVCDLAPSPSASPAADSFSSGAAGLSNINNYNGELDGEPVGWCEWLFARSRTKLDLYVPTDRSLSFRKAHKIAQEQEGKDDGAVTKAGVSKMSAIPIIIHCHGGGWQRGDYRNEWRGGPVLGRSIAEAGALVAVVNYRLCAPSYGSLVLRGVLLAWIPTLIVSFTLQENLGALYGLCVGALLVLQFIYFKCLGGYIDGHPRQVKDIVTAVAWVKKYVRDFVPYADPNRIFLCGHSAGAHLVSLVGTHPTLLTEAGIADRKSCIKGVIAISGIYTVDKPLGESDCDSCNFCFRVSYTHAAFGFTMEEWRDSSPFYIIEDDLKNPKPRVIPSIPPFLIMNAESDFGLEHDGMRFHKILEKANVEVQYQLIEGCRHDSIGYDFHSLTAARNLVIEFLLEKDTR